MWGRAKLGLQGALCEDSMSWYLRHVPSHPEGLSQVLTPVQAQGHRDTALGFLCWLTLCSWVCGSLFVCRRSACGCLPFLSSLQNFYLPFSVSCLDARIFRSCYYIPGSVEGALRSICRRLCWETCYPHTKTFSHSLSGGRGSLLVTTLAYPSSLSSMTLCP